MLAYLFILGAALVVTGVALVSIPLAFVLAGLTLCGGSFVVHRGTARLAAIQSADGGSD